MAEKPIIFSGPMVRAILEGNKTQTRRVLKDVPEWCDHAVFSELTLQGHISFRGEFNNWGPSETFIKLPHLVGDHLWVKENYRAPARYDHLKPSELPIGCDIMHEANWWDSEITDWNAGKLRSSLFMPRWAARIELLVTDVRVQRLQDISEEDAIAEGATSRPNCSGFRSQETGWNMDWVGALSKYTSNGPGPLIERDISLASPVSAFANFINRLHGGPNWNLKPTDLWTRNPWVVAYTFERVK